MTAERYELLFKYDHQGLEGFDKASAGTRAVKSETLLLAQALGATVAAIGAGTAALVSFVKGQADAQRELAITSARLGVTAQQGQQLQYAMNAAGVSMGVMEAAAKQLTSRNLETERTLKALGITTTDITGRQRAAGAVFIETAGKLSQIRSEFDRSRQAAAAFGPEAAAALEPLLKTGQLLGPALDEGLTKNLENARLQIARLDAEWEQLKTTFGGALAPIVVSIVATARGAISNPAARGNAATASGLAAEFAAGREDEAINLSPSGILAGTVAGSGGIAHGFISSDLAAGAALSAGFSRNSVEGLRARRSVVSAKISALSQRLASGTIGGDSFRIQKAELDQLASELKTIEERLKVLSEDPNKGALKLAELQRPSAFPRPGIAPSLFRPGEVFTAPESDRRGQTTAELQAELNRGFGQGLIQSGQDRQARDLNRVRTILDLETRRVQLLAGPGGEEAAVKRITELRLDALNREIALGADIRDAELERLRIAADGENQLLELQRKRAEQYRDFFGAAVLASISGDGGGLSGFGKQQLRALQAQISTNLGSIVFDKVGPILGRATGGKDGTTGSGLIDRILGGTIFDPKNAQERNTQALNRLTAAITATSIGLGGGGVGSRVFGGATNAAGTIFSAVGGSGLPAGLPDPQLIASQGASATLGFPVSLSSTGGFSNQYGSKGATAAVYGAALAAGAFGIRSGLKQGGGKGALNAVAAGAGAAAAIDPEPVSKAVLAAVAVGASLVSSILGDPKQNFDKAQSELLKSRLYQAPEGLDITTDFATGGTTAGYGIRGNAPRIVVNVNAIDAKSFMDRSGDIADALGGAIAAGHPLRYRLAELPFTG